jgi:hypothetical protein
VSERVGVRARRTARGKVLFFFDDFKRFIIVIVGVGVVLSIVNYQPMSNRRLVTRRFLNTTTGLFPSRCPRSRPSLAPSISFFPRPCGSLGFWLGVARGSPPSRLLCVGGTAFVDRSTVSRRPLVDCSRG